MTCSMFVPNKEAEEWGNKLDDELRKLLETVREKTYLKDIYIEVYTYQKGFLFRKEKTLYQLLFKRSVTQEGLAEFTVFNFGPESYGKHSLGNSMVDRRTVGAWLFGFLDGYSYEKNQGINKI